MYTVDFRSDFWMLRGMFADLGGLSYTQASEDQEKMTTDSYHQQTIQVLWPNSDFWIEIEKKSFSSELQSVY